jgi:carbamoylphosphate synthase large subunit
MITELDPIKGCKPTTTILKPWIDNDWLPIADETDKKVSLELESRMIADKVEMLNRHAGVAREMQDKALEYLRENGVGTARNAIELLVKGLEIERNSVGAPVIAAKLSDLTDVQLLDELKLLVSSSKIDTIEPVIDIE